MNITLLGSIFALTWLVLTSGSAAGPMQSAQTQQPAVARLYAAATESWEALETAILQGRAEGLPEQVILEAQVVYAIKAEDDTHFDSIIERLEANIEHWDYTESRLGKSKTEMQAVIAVLQARQAYLKRDETTFAQAAKEAFWLNPQLAPVLGSWIEKYRLEQQMNSIVFPMNTQLQQSDGGETSLATVVEGKKAVLVSFWASWCGPCIQLMPEVVRRSEVLGKQDVIVVGINVEDSTKAERERKKRQIQFPWLVDSTSNPITALLHIQAFPSAVLVSPDGKILFNGHPMDPGLKTALDKLEVML